MFIDTHTLVHGPEFDTDREAALTRARSAGVEVCIAVGTDVEDSRRALELAGKHADVYAAVGVHPHEAAKVTAAELDGLARAAESGRVVAWGETGLDYYYEHSPRDVQRA
jgi:TatD DNase family protein